MGGKGARSDTEKDGDPHGPREEVQDDVAALMGNHTKDYGIDVPREEQLVIKVDEDPDTARLVHPGCRRDAHAPAQCIEATGEQGLGLPVYGQRQTAAQTRAEDGGQIAEPERLVIVDDGFRTGPHAFLLLGQDPHDRDQPPFTESIVEWR